MNKTIFSLHRKIIVNNRKAYSRNANAKSLQ